MEIKELTGIAISALEDKKGEDILLAGINDFFMKDIAIRHNSYIHSPTTKV